MYCKTKLPALLYGIIVIQYAETAGVGTEVPGWGEVETIPISIKKIDIFIQYFRCVNIKRMESVFFVFLIHTTEN